MNKQLKRNTMITNSVVSKKRDRKMQKFGFLVLAILLLSLNLAASEEKLSGEEIAYRHQYRPTYQHDECTALEMKLINAKGQIRKREFLRYQMKFPLEDPGKEPLKKTLIKFLYPNDIKDTGTYNEEVSGRDDIQDLYLPAAKKLRRISVKNQSWMGSDFNYEDLQELEFSDYRYDYLRSEAVDGIDCYVYSMTPVTPDKSIYGKQIRWVEKNEYYLVRTEYYDQAMQLIKTNEFRDFQKVNGVTYAWTILAESLADHHRTEMKRRWIFLETGLDEKRVTTRYLEKPIDTYNHPSDLWTIWKKTLTN
ncbi:MAG: outer membrane lipoprotein-sorting protein [Candidatus Omnitrophica bacterium]|nr:outer membrane lipoprotein-sorting protein [Candidatus Omnitrophota bacterium]